MNIQTAFYESPIGTMKITLENDLVSGIQFQNEDTKADTPEHPAMKFLFQELDAYFNGNLEVFASKVSISGTQFETKVWNTLRDIPYAQIRSYKDIAKLLGDVNSVRAVGGANGRNRIPILIPCHRVIGEDGSLTGFSGGIERKSWLLHHEGAIAEQLTFF